jgi:phosphoribosylamine--glycine ligase
MRVLCVGSGGREHAIVKALRRSNAEVLAAMRYRNPGIAREAEGVLLAAETDVERIVPWAKAQAPDLAIIGPEAPLAAGLGDALEEVGIPTAGPSRSAVMIEASKEFARDLMARHHIPGLVEYHAFGTPKEVERFLRSCDYDLAVKPAGLTGGKGVRILGEHLRNKAEVLAYAAEVLGEAPGGLRRVVLERKEVGEEFSLQAFVDGRTVAPLPAAQDYKRAYEGDRGPNTGGMGSISAEDGLLPFLPRADFEKAVRIMERTVDALRAEGNPFKGILYGGFMLTREGPKVLEFNARFADPESMNVLPLLKGDFAQILFAVAHGELKPHLEFQRRATVCKYLVPEGYGTVPREGERITVDEEAIRKEGAELFYASLDARPDGFYTTTSRSLAVVGIAGDITKAYTMAEDGVKHVRGRVYVRHDIGHPDTIRAKVKRMRDLRRPRT